MPGDNFEIKLQKTIAMMQEINNLAGETEILANQAREEGYTKKAVLQLKQSILNQSQKDFSVVQARLSDPPMIKIKLGDKNVFIADQKAIKALRKELSMIEMKMDISQGAVEVAKGQVQNAQSQSAEKDQVRNILESELDQLYSNVGSLLQVVRSNKKSALKNMKQHQKDAASHRDKENLSDISKNENIASDGDNAEYFNNNMHVTEFNKALNSSTTSTAHMAINPVGEE